jgi:hypothetical protein
MHLSHGLPQPQTALSPRLPGKDQDFATLGLEDAPWLQDTAPQGSRLPRNAPRLPRKASRLPGPLIAVLSKGA